MPGGLHAVASNARALLVLYIKGAEKYVCMCLQSKWFAWGLLLLFYSTPMSLAQSGWYTVGQTSWNLIVLSVYYPSHRDSTLFLGNTQSTITKPVQVVVEIYIWHTTH